ncbi:MAG TPA: hypothetical protein QGI39_04615 [Gammaproteobacteria bacterium]|nr:hypothetical protein [Gammaproteobacteria bacterium]
MVFTRFGLVVICVVLQGCAASQAPLYDPVTWYAVISGSRLTIVVYDNVCKRRHGNVRLSGRRETAVTTCGDSEGRANVRYQLEGYMASAGDWVERSRVTQNQRIYVQ